MTFVQKWWRPCVGVAVLVLGLALWVFAAHRVPASTVWADEPAKSYAFVVDPAKSKVHWTLGSSLHTVHGTFAVKSGKITVDPATGKASGDLVIDALSGESGNDGRDKKMHAEIIESGKYREIAFRPDRVDGNLQAKGSTKVQIHGVFSFHGVDHELTVGVNADFAPDHWTGTTKFTVPYIAWGLKSPSNFFLKADPTVDVELELAGSVK